MFPTVALGSWQNPVNPKSSRASFQPSPRCSPSLVGQPSRAGTLQPPGQARLEETCEVVREHTCAPGREFAGSREGQRLSLCFVSGSLVQ